MLWTTDIGIRSQLLLYIRIPDIDSYSIVDEYFVLPRLEWEHSC